VSSVVPVGAVVSMLKGKAPVGALSTPAALTAVAVMLWLPWVSGLAGVKIQSPLASLVAVPMATPLSNTLILRFAPAVPTTVGVVSSVTPVFWIGPCTVPTLSSTRVIAGATGPLASTTIG
jgi:hypothetical protein